MISFRKLFMNFLFPALCGLFFGITDTYSQSNQPTVPSMATWSMRKNIIDLAAKNTPFKVLTSLQGRRK